MKPEKINPDASPGPQIGVHGTGQPTTAQPCLAVDDPHVQKYYSHLPPPLYSQIPPPAYQQSTQHTGPVASFLRREIIDSGVQTITIPVSEMDPEMRRIRNRAHHNIMFGAFVAFCCNFCCGLAAIGCGAWAAQDINEGDRSGAKSKNKIALVLNVAGVITGILVIVMVILYCCFVILRHTSGFN